MFLTRSGVESILPSLLYTSCSSPLICLSSLCFSLPVSPPSILVSPSASLVVSFSRTSSLLLSLFCLSLLSLSCLLLTLFIAHTVSPSRSSSTPLLSPLSLFTPSFILYSWHRFLFTHFHPHFPLQAPNLPLLSSSITLAFPGCLSSPPFILPSS